MFPVHGGAAAVVQPRANPARGLADTLKGAWPRANPARRPLRLLGAWSWRYGEVAGQGSRRKGGSRRFGALRPRELPRGRDDRQYLPSLGFGFS